MKSLFVKLNWPDQEQTCCCSQEQPAMTSSIVKAKFKGKCDDQTTYAAKICAPRTPMVWGMPSIVNMDENNICSIVLENCPPYDVTLERDNILGIMDTEEEEMVPLMDDFISSVSKTSTTTFQK
jgi:hypothetical protein